jgi:NADH dehydrogenase [ubiquinone] 1 alpha subcomplex assembly factor 1
MSAKLNSRRNFLCTSGVYLLCWSKLSHAQGTRMDFTNPKTMRDCWIVNDGVMGGVSQSALRQDTQGMYFEGLVSLENNGGFASMRSSAQFPPGTQVLKLLAKGDGKQYKLVLRTAIAPRVNYAADFIAEPTWQTHQFNLNQFKPTFRGQVIDAPTLSFADVIEFGILISNSQAGRFAIQLKTLQSA